MKQFNTPTRSCSPTRVKRKIRITATKLLEIKNIFDTCIEEIKKRFVLVDTLTSGNASKDEIAASEDILRFQLVSVDSIFDLYIHQIFSYGIKKIFNEEWEKTNIYNNINISLPIVENILLNPEDISWIENIIDGFKAKDTFMCADNLVGALNAIGIKFNDVATSLGYATPQVLKEKINEIYNRRTSIVHYADINITTKTKNTITKALIEDYIDIIEKVCGQIYNEITNKDANS